MKRGTNASIEAIDERKQEQQSLLETIDTLGQLEQLGSNRDSTRVPQRK
jgi:hypothetical protein